MARERTKPQPKPRSFRLRAQTGEDAPIRVSFGADPRISIGAGETYTTEDERLCQRLAREPLLEEVEG